MITGKNMMRLLAFLLCCGFALSGCSGGLGPKSTLPEADSVLFIPEAGREVPRDVLGIRAQRVGVIPAEEGETRVDGILRLADENGDFADVFVYGGRYEIEIATIGGVTAYRVESWGLVEGRPYGALSYAFPSGVVIDVYDGPDPEIRHTEEGRGLLELYWASDDMETPRRTLIGENRVRELILGAGSGDDVYRDWSQLETVSARYLGGRRDGDGWCQLNFAGADGKTFQLSLPDSRKILLPLLAALKGRPVTLVQGYGRVDAGNRLYKGPLLYGVSAVPSRREVALESARPESGAEKAGE